MIPKIGQNIKCLYKNNTIVEGIVEEWSIKDNSGTLLLDDNSRMILNHINEDILMIKIFPAKEVIKKIMPAQVKTELEEQFQEVYKLPSEDDLRLKNLADLKLLLIEQDKKIILDRLKDHNVSSSKVTKYGYPGFLTKSSSK